MKKTKIDWCDSTWNPVTGCLHGCEYCYARKIAKRFGGYDGTGENHVLDVRQVVRHRNDEGEWNPAYKCAYPFSFDPTFHRYKLGEPKCWTKPRNIFVCSMADLFGEWVPDEWIEEVFETCKATPQHRYLFLTKNPTRYADWPARVRPKNAWLGASYTGEGKYTRQFGPVNTFLSIEPLLAPISQATANTIALWNDWVIIGAETGTRKNKVTPEKTWIDQIVMSCKAVQTPVFMKESLREIMGEDFIQEYPWGGNDNG